MRSEHSSHLFVKSFCLHHRLSFIIFKRWIQFCPSRSGQRVSLAQLSLGKEPCYGQIQFSTAINCLTVFISLHWRFALPTENWTKYFILARMNDTIVPTCDTKNQRLLVFNLTHLLVSHNFVKEWLKFALAITESTLPHHKLFV